MYFVKVDVNPPMSRKRVIENSNCYTNESMTILLGKPVRRRSYVHCGVADNCFGFSIPIAHLTACTQYGIRNSTYCDETEVYMYRARFPCFGRNDLVGLPVNDKFLPE